MNDDIKKVVESDAINKSTSEPLGKTQESEPLRRRTVRSRHAPGCKWHLHEPCTCKG